MCVVHYTVPSLYAGLVLTHSSSPVLPTTADYLENIRDVDADVWALTMNEKAR